YQESVEKNSLVIARTTTFTFLILTILLASQYESFGGVLGLIVMWFGALVGPIAIPMLFGMMPLFKKCNSAAAILSIVGGLVAFIFTKTVDVGSMALEVSLPLMVSFVIYVSLGLFKSRSSVPKNVNDFMALLFRDKEP